MQTFYKTCLPVLSLGILLAGSAFAQKAERLELKPTNGKLPAAIKSQTYYYPEFKSGRVSLANGITSTSTLNYNMLSGEIEFINSRKDTLALADMHYVKMLTIEADTFFYNPDDQVLLKLLADYNNTRLLVKEKYELANIKNIGAMGMESSTSSPTSSSRNQVVGDTQNRLKQNETLVYSLKSDYYFTNKGGFMPATKANAYKLSPKHKSDIKEYIKENDTDFSNEEQLRELLKYIDNL